jgi:hypothetical protein
MAGCFLSFPVVSGRFRRLRANAGRSGGSPACVPGGVDNRFHSQEFE